MVLAALSYLVQEPAVISKNCDLEWEQAVQADKLLEKELELYANLGRNKEQQG